MDADAILNELRSIAQPENLPGMARYGIDTADALGVSIPALRKIARRLGKDHTLARALWSSGIHEARILAAMVDDPDRLTSAQMDRWVKKFDSWDICDQVCSNLFDRTPFAYDKARAWAGRPETFVRRAGFTLMACLAVHDKAAPDAKLAAFLPLIVKGAGDDRNFVKKAVSWALRQIGKRNRALNAKALACAERIAKIDSKPARWIARDALRELTSPKVRARIDS